MCELTNQIIDRYRVTECLGKGGMAVVYKAYDTRLARDVALKLIRMGSIPADHHERLLSRFAREARTQARLSHPNILPVYADGELNGEPYLVMAYLPGGTLKDKLGQPYDYQTVIRWVLPIADALAYAHSMSVIHRDVKPSNILFDRDQVPLLADFGIAKILDIDDMTLTATGLGVGTPEYMAPEQWLGDAVFASDQYAVGVLLYELLTGQKPYIADTPFGVALMQLDDPLVPPRELVPDIPEAVEWLVMKAMAPDPQERFGAMSEFEKALEAVLAGDEDILNSLSGSGAFERNKLDISSADPDLASEAETFEINSHFMHVEQLSAVSEERTEDQLEATKRTRKRSLWWMVPVSLSLLLGGSLFTAMRWGVPFNPPNLPGMVAAELTQNVLLPTIFPPTVAPMLANTSTLSPMQSPLVEFTPTLAPTETLQVVEVEEVLDGFLTSFNYVHDNAIKHYNGETGEISWVMDIVRSANPQPLRWNSQWNETRWSGDGRYLLYSPKSSEKDGSWDYYDNGLYIYDTLAKQAITVSDRLNRFRLLPWSPNHEFALFSSDIEGVPGLFIYDISQQQLFTVAYLTQGSTNLTVSWSGDSQFLDFRATGSQTVRRYDLQTSELSDSPAQSLSSDAASQEQIYIEDYYWGFPFLLEEDDARAIYFDFGTHCLTINQKPDMTESNKLCFNEEVSYLGKSHNQQYHFFSGYEKLYYVDFDDFEVQYFELEPGFSSPKECVDLN